MVYHIMIFTETQFFNQCPVTGQVVLAQVSKQAFPAAYHFHPRAERKVLCYLSGDLNVVDTFRL